MTQPQELTDFLNYIATVRGQSARTIDAYRSDLTMFLKYLSFIRQSPPGKTSFEETQIKNITESFYKDTTLSELYSFMGWLKNERGNSAYARARKTASVRTFFKFLQGKLRIIDYNPAAELESPALKKTQPVYLTLDESVKLLKSMDKKDKDYIRDTCILTLFLNCGLRLSELTSIKFSDIKEDTVRIIGKGAKERTLYLNRASLKAIEDLKEERKADRYENLPDDTKPFLFISSHKKPISTRTVERIVEKHLKNAGIWNDGLSPHKLRHTAATLMYKYGNVDMKSLQSVLGHENISTTQIYTHTDEEQLREAVKSNPLADIEDWK